MHTQAEAEAPAGPGWSTKLQAVLDELDHVQTHFPGEKVVIFSQFTSFLDIIQAALAQRQELIRTNLEQAEPRVGHGRARDQAEEQLGRGEHG